MKRAKGRTRVRPFCSQFVLRSEQGRACGQTTLVWRMEVKLSPGKRKRLESVSDSRGVIAALAIDQRDALRKLFSDELKIEKHAVPREQLEEFKSLVVRALSPHA